ncbi:MAG TPA: pilus assembly protein TadG-related protein [Tepidisphaeraceae bacterium]|jgi:Flp pilus assembly protein TadG
MVYVVVMMTVLFAFASLSADVGRVYLAKSQLQTAADAAARAACQALPNGGASAARKAAKDAAKDNLCDTDPVSLDPNKDLTFGNWDTASRTFTPMAAGSEDNANSVKVTLSRTAANGNPIPLIYGRAVGQRACDIRATSTACSIGNTGAYAIIGINYVTITGGATGSYNSSKGAYNKGSNSLHHGAIASNGNINISGNTMVDGDVRFGVGKSAAITPPAKASGMVAQLGTTLSFPSTTLPASYTDAGDCIMSSGTIHVAGGNYVFGTIDLSGDAHIIWDGPTKFWVRTAYKVKDSVVIDTYGNVPANRVIYFLPTCKVATWTGTNSCVGELYAPDTDFTISGSAQLYGRITAKSITLSSDGGLYYDEALAPIGTGATKYTISRVQ